MTEIRDGRNVVLAFDDEAQLQFYLDTKHSSAESNAKRCQIEVSLLKSPAHGLGRQFSG